MILAEKIALLRKQNGWSQEELAEKCNVSRQSVSKWESTTSMPDLDKILKLSEIFGVSTDYLLKDKKEEIITEYIDTDYDNSVRRVTLEEANTYIETSAVCAKQISLGIALCILSPTVLILLAGICESHPDRLSENAAMAIGLLFLLLMVVIAVPIFIIAGNKLEQYKFISEETFEPEYGIQGLVETKLKTYENIFIRNITLGVTLCILSVIPLVIGSLLTENEIVILILVDVLLILVALAVILFVQSGMTKDCYKQLLQAEDFTPASKKLNRQMSPIAAIYWCLATAVYLGISFYTMRWDRTWILWPCAGVLYAVVDVIGKQWLSRKSASNK